MSMWRKEPLHPKAKVLGFAFTPTEIAKEAFRAQRGTPGFDLWADALLARAREDPATQATMTFRFEWSEVPPYFKFLWDWTVPGWILLADEPGPDDVQEHIGAVLNWGRVFPGSGEAPLYFQLHGTAWGAALLVHRYHGLPWDCRWRPVRW